MIKATKMIAAIDAKEEAMEFERIYIHLTEKVIVYKTPNGETTKRALTPAIYDSLVAAFIGELAKDETFKNISTAEAVKE